MRLWQAKLVVIVSCSLGAVSTSAVDIDTSPPKEKHFVQIPRPAAPAKPAVPAETPAPVQTTPEIDALIRQLGDTDFRKREAAVAKLKEIGQPALPALEQARVAASDPEVVSRAESVIRYLTRPPVPSAQAVRGSGRLLPNRGDFNIRFSAVNGENLVEVREPGRNIRIAHGVNGIRMAVTGMENGKEVTREYTARTPEELKKQNPEAFELFQHWTGRAAGQGLNNIQRRAEIRRMPRANQLLPLVPPASIGPGDELRELRDLLRQHQNFGDPGRDLQAQREEILKLLDQMAEQHRELREQTDGLQKRLRDAEGRAEEVAPGK